MTADTAIAGGTIVGPDGVRPGTLVLRDGRIAGIAEPDDPVTAAETIDARGLHVLPGAIDIHCHIRAPAFPERATVRSETAACAAGGVTTVFEMPITDPCCNTPAQVAMRRDHFARHAHVDFALYAAPRALTEAAFDALAEAGVVALKIFTTPAPPGRHREFDGLAWPDAADQRRVLELAARTGLPVVVHAEHPQLLARAATEAETLDRARAATHEAARPALAEALAVAQLLTLNIDAGAKLHIAHVTSAATLDVLRRFAGSSDVSAETCPHYLRHTRADVDRVGVCGKINPPVRGEADRQALWEALADGTIAHVTTDHAAFAAAEKAAHEGDFLAAPPGHPGLEVLLPTMLDGVAEGRLTLAEAVRLVAGAAADRFALDEKGRLVPGAQADIVLVDLAGRTEIDAARMMTAARDVARLSHGISLGGRIARTLVAGRTVWDGRLRGEAGLGRFVRPHRMQERTP
ncbi:MULTISPECIES: dihydroorotase family protein [unclassified Roseitalea]|uniref:dihydroorotase n=1 Tax=unclassified Roseitalea TaxID=2639107 RepID=UPI00273FD668|nr:MULTISPECIES: dihydroorotase family protein [unclassified Roseitalea]